MLLEDPESIDEILMAQPYMSSNDLAFMGGGEVEVEGWFFATRMVDGIHAPLAPDPPETIRTTLRGAMRWTCGRRVSLAIVAVTPIGATESVVSEREREAEAEMAAGDADQDRAGERGGYRDRRPP